MSCTCRSTSTPHRNWRPGQTNSTNASLSSRRTEGPTKVASASRTTRGSPARTWTTSYRTTGQAPPTGSSGSTATNFRCTTSPCPTASKAWDDAGADAVEGFFVDRVTIDGVLRPFLPAAPLADQYPVCCNFTERVLGAYVGKLVCARGWLRVDDGNHRVALKQYARLADQLVPVHHFKWTAEALPRLQRRVTPEWQRTKFWWRESQRGLDHIHEHGGIDLSSVDILTGDGELVRPAQALRAKATARWNPHHDG